MVFLEGERAIGTESWLVSERTVLLKERFFLIEGGDVLPVIDNEPLGDVEMFLANGDWTFEGPGFDFERENGLNKTEIVAGRRLLTDAGARALVEAIS